MGIDRVALLEVIVEEGATKPEGSEGSLEPSRALAREGTAVDWESQSTESDWICCAARGDDFVYCEAPCFRGFGTCYMVSTVLCVIGCGVAIGLGFWAVWRG
jgi:hypothetical protein